MVKANYVTGHESIIKIYGVRQSSVLDLILFILYINSIYDFNIDILMVRQQWHGEVEYSIGQTYI